MLLKYIKINQIVYLAIIISLLVSSCAGNPADIFPLRGTSWKMTVLNGEALPAGVEVTLMFNQHGKITGHAPCNDYFAFYKQRGIYVIFEESGSTRVNCSESGVMALEMAYLQNVEKVRSFQVKDSTLTFYDDINNPLMVFTR